MAYAHRDSEQVPATDGSGDSSCNIIDSNGGDREAPGLGQVDLEQGVEAWPARQAAHREREKKERSLRGRHAELRRAGQCMGEALEKLLRGDALQVTVALDLSRAYRPTASVVLEAVYARLGAAQSAIDAWGAKIDQVEQLDAQLRGGWRS